MTIVLHGIPNCDTVKKARAWLDDRGVAYDFHDYKKAGADAGRLREWIREAGWEKVLNRAGTSFRKLPDAEKEGLDADKAMAIMIGNPSTIKRPIVTGAGPVLIGFKADEWERRF